MPFFTVSLLSPFAAFRRTLSVARGNLSFAELDKSLQGDSDFPALPYYVPTSLMMVGLLHELYPQSQRHKVFPSEADDGIRRRTRRWGSDVLLHQQSHTAAKCFHQKQRMIASEGEVNNGAAIMGKQMVVAPKGEEIF